MENGTYESQADIHRYILFEKSVNNHTAAHFHNSCEVVIVLEGKIAVRGNGTEKVLSRGDIFFAERYVTHIYKSLDETRAFIWVLSDFYLSGFRSLYKGVFPMFMYAGEDGNESLLAFLERTYAEWGHYNLLMRRSAVEWMIGYLAARYPPVEKPKKGDGFLITDILRYIDENFSQDLSVEGVAKTFGYTPNYFSYLFHRYTDMHFRAYLNRIRLRETDKRMKVSGIGVVAAAQQCGFSSMNTYYRALMQSKKEDTKI